MKDELCNIANSWVTIHKKMFYGHIAYKNIEDFSCKCGTNVRHVILSGVMTLEIKLEKLKYMLDFTIVYYV
jgi:hypothetical protein